MKTPNQVIAGINPELRDTVARLRKVAQRTAPDLEEAVRWDALAYVGRRVVCAIMPHAHHVNLQLFRGAELLNRGFDLEGNGKAMRHLKVVPGQPLDEAKIGRLLAAAARLDASG
ncbi:MAG: DUF1801 domain-containing protein [Acidobacteria bacterium]|nr:DUF1801 domain-containing protein [Acidobacteriota bacterium]